MQIPLSSQNRTWLISSALIAAMTALPVIAIIYLALNPEENIWRHLYQTVLTDYLFNTVILMAGVAVLTFLLGIGSAWLVTMYQFPGQRLLQWALLLPFAMPAYVIAYVYTDMLEYAGPVQTFLRALFGWQRATDYWFPEIRSLGGAIIMMSLVLYPYVYMLARAAFLEQSMALFAVTRSLGRSPFQYFYKVSLPMARPSIAIGVALCLMEALNDFGTVDYFAVKTFTAGLYDIWLNMDNLGGAAQIATVMMIFVVVLILFERHSRKTQKLYQYRSNTDPIPAQPLKGWQATLALILGLIPLLFGFLLPFISLTHNAVLYFEESWTDEFFSHALNSFGLAIMASISTLVIGLILGYNKRLNKNRFATLFVRMAGLGYSIPGAVLAIGIIIPFAAFDNGLDQLLRQHFNISSGLLLSGTAFAILSAYTIRFLAVSAGTVESSLDKVTPSMDMAARSLGRNSLQTLLQVHLPIIRPGLLTAVLVVFVDCMKELPATLILRPFNFDTLATHVYQYASDELLEQSSLAALVIVLVGILPIILLSKSIDQRKSRQAVVTGN